MVDACMVSDWHDYSDKKDGNESFYQVPVPRQEGYPEKSGEQEEEQSYYFPEVECLFF